MTGQTVILRGPKGQNLYDIDELTRQVEQAKKKARAAQKRLGDATDAKMIAALADRGIVPGVKVTTNGTGRPLWGFMGVEAGKPILHALRSTGAIGSDRARSWVVSQDLVLWTGDET